MGIDDGFGLAAAGELQHRQEAGQRRLRAAYDLGHGRRPGSPVVLTSVAAVDSQLGQIGDQWPADTVMDLLNRIHADLAGQVERVDGLLVGLEGDGEPEDAA